MASVLLSPLWTRLDLEIILTTSTRKFLLCTQPLRADEFVVSFQEIVNYLERQYDDILAEQSRIKRNPRFRDNRVHALLYFIPPTGHA